MKKCIKFISLLLAVLITLPCVNVFAAGFAKTLGIGGAGGKNVGVIDENNVLWLWGDNHYYQLCNGSQNDSVTPIKFMENVKNIEINHAVCAAIKNDNSLWLWGDSRLIHWSEDDWGQKTPLKVMEDVKSVKIGNYVAGVIKTDGSLWMWGYNNYGTIGDGKVGWQEYSYPSKIMDDVESFDISERFVAAVKKDGSLWLWGENSYCETEDNSYWDLKEEGKIFAPYKVMDNVKQVSLGAGHFAALKKDGSLLIWGDNRYGQLGVGEKEITFAVPEKILDDVEQISLFDNTSAAIKADGSLWCWGSNSEGAVGAGLDEKTAKTINSPVKILDNVAFVRLGGTCGAVKKDGSLWMWGYLGASDKSGMTALGLYLEDLRNNKTAGYIPYPVEYKGIKVKLAYDENMCTISLELSGGTGKTKISCQKDGFLTPPDNPYKDGFYFAGWYKDAECTQAWNFDVDKVQADCTLYAKWLPKSTVTVIADPSTQNIIIDGEEVVLNTYVLRDAQGFDVNFVKLRDVAYLLNKTKANFNVDWRNNAIRLDKKKEYTTQNGAELTVPTVVSAPTKTSITPVLTDGVTAPLEAFLLIDDNGGGHNYFKLRDIGKVAGFNVEWDSEHSCIVVTTTESYKE